MNDFERVKEIRKEIDGYSAFVKINLIWKPREENLAGKYIESKFKI